MGKNVGKEGGAKGGIDRRRALALALTAVGSVATGLFLRGAGRAEAAPLRPPGALDEADFLAACIRCFQCASVCPNQCIQFEGPEGGIGRAYAPFIRPREQACILCMKCTEACPTDALTPIANDIDSISQSVRMGTAKVNEDLCYSYANRACGVCYYACPLPDRALKLKAGARPVVDANECVGCGSCERACIHLPQAIRITPRQV